MSLKEETLFGLVDKVAMALERIRHFEKQALAMNPDGYFVAFSGGKDSIVVLDLIRRAGVKHTAHFHMTTVDPPELLDFIRKNYAGAVVWERPKKSMFQLIVEKRMPPTRVVRYCCDKLKEGGGDGRIVVTGVRWAESAKRSKRAMVETCMRNGRKVYLHPVIEWSDAEVWQYIRENGLPYPSLYDEGHKRIGCIGCPMGSNRERDFARWPKFEAMYRKAIARMIERNVRDLESGIYNPPASVTVFRSVDEVWAWWMSKVEPDAEITRSLFE